MAFNTLNHHRMATAVLTPLLLFVLLLPRIQASEDTESPRVKLGPWVSNLNVEPGMNASGRCMKGSEFVGQDLRGAVFNDCALDGVVFYQCDLSRASFKGALLTGMNITDCRIQGADFADAIINGIVGMSGGLTDPPHSGWPHDMHLSDEQLMSTRSYKTKDLRKCVISLYNRHESSPPKYDFRGAHLEGAYLHHGDFSECDFTDACIDGIDMVLCTIGFQQLASTDNFKNRRTLHAARFSTIRATDEWDLSGMDLTGTRQFPYFKNYRINFTNANIARCMFGRAVNKDQLRSTRNFKEGDLGHIKFSHIDFSGFDFSRVNLTGSEFPGCDFTGASFDDAVITGVRFAEHRPQYILKHDFPDPTGLTLGQIKSTWNYKNRRMEGIVLPKELADALSAEKR
jgi:uncharacterized protein YjbI with pentapeptide repeats